MITFLRKNITIILAGLVLAGASFAVSGTVSAQPDIGQGLSCGSNFSLTSEGGCEEIEAGADRVEGIITTIVNVFSIIVAIVAVIMIIWGGFKYITSGGDSGNITTAKNTIIYAIIGLVIVALAQFLVQFVLKTVLAE